MGLYICLCMHVCMHVCMYGVRICMYAYICMCIFIILKEYVNDVYRTMDA